MTRHVAFALFVLIYVVAAAFVPRASAQSAPPADERPRLSERGCSIAADMVLVARALASESVARAKADAIMALVYAEYADGGRSDRLRNELTDFGYRRSDAPLELAHELMAACLTHGGLLGPILGTRTQWRF